MSFTRKRPHFDTLLCERLEERTLLAADLLQMPLVFEPNVGQTDARVQFLSRGQGYGLFLTPGEAVLNLYDSDDTGLGTVLQAQFVGANLDAPATGLVQQEGHVNYYVGQDPADWHTDVSLFGKVQYTGIYPGIDLIYYGTQQRQLEYDFVVAPGADPASIKIAFEGADRVSLDDAGNLVLHTANGDVVQHAPIVYQESGGRREAVSGSFVLEGNQVGFRLGAYDRSRPLVIDPVMVYATYHGGSGLDDALDIGIDVVGQPYIAGYTRSADFPLLGAADGTFAGSSEAFVTKLNRAGNTMLFSTYFGGSGNEVDLGAFGGQAAMEVDAQSGWFLLTGSTQSSDFPLLAPLDSTLGGTQDAFFLIADFNGVLQFSTYIGGSGVEAGTGVALALNGNRYITGTTSSNDFPLVAARQGTPGGGLDGFLVCINNLNAVTLFSTYLGGSGNDMPLDLDTDSSNSVIIAGRTQSSDFPATLGLDTTLGGASDGFVTKFNTLTTTLIFSTYLGGGGDENLDPAHGTDVGSIAVDGLNNIYVTGSTSSSDFPLFGPYDSTLGGTWDAYVTKLDASGVTVYSTYLGGSGNDIGTGIAVDGFRNPFVTGYTESADYPTTSPTQATLAGSRDAYVAALDPLGIAPFFATFLGGPGGTEGDIGRAIAINYQDQPIIVGFTDSTTFPTRSPRQGTYGGAGDGFIARIGVIPGVTINWQPNNRHTYVPTVPATVGIIEGGTTSTFSIVLNDRPTANVVITLTPNGQQTLSTTLLTFTPANWNTNQNVTATAVDDAISESTLPATHPGVITLVATSTDSNYNNIAIPQVTCNVTDNDSAGVFFNFDFLPNRNGINLFENLPANDFYTIRLLSIPTADVFITLGPDTQVTTSATVLTFTSTNWFAQQTVTVSAVDDAAVEGAHNGLITHTASSADPTYNGFGISTITGSIVDNDFVGTTVVNTNGLVVTEDGPTDFYTIVLNSPPTADVIITLNPGTQLSVSPGILTFTAADWFTPQTVTVTAVNDASPEAVYPLTNSGTITQTPSSADLAYNAVIIPTLTAAITDNDRVNIFLAQSGGTTAVNEQGPTSDSYTVVLTSTPTANVFITVTDDSQISVAPTVVTFTPTTWWLIQTINVTAIDDGNVEGAHNGIISHMVSSADASYNGFALAPVTAAITDNENAGLFLLETFGFTSVSEIGATSDIYSVRLLSQPTANVTVNLNPGSQLTVSTATLTFTPLTWNTPQTVTVAAVDDQIAETLNHVGTVDHTTSSSDANYNGTVTTLTADITDNDTAGMTLVESGGSTSVGEGGLPAGPANDTYTIVLLSQPTANVFVTLTPDAQLTTTPAVVTFTAANWSVAQTVSLSAFDDFMVETSPHQGTVNPTVTSADTFYDAFALAAVTANIGDNDVGGVAMTQSGGSTDVTEGLTPGDTYSIVLTSRPTSNVVIALSPGTQLTASPASLTFTPANWNTLQTVTVLAVDDLVFEGVHTGIISHTPTSTDPVYRTISIPSLTANIVDNDAVGIIQSGNSTDVTEAGLTDSYTLQLASMPTANVVITFNPGSQVTVTPTPITFTPATWNVPQAVTIGAVDDPVAEGTHNGLLAHTSSSGDPFYHSVVIPTVTVHITDNDTARVDVTPSGGTTFVTEGASGDLYDVVLNSQPTANVTITINPDPALTVSPTALVFTPANWSLPQTVTVTAVDDGLQQSTRTRFITHVAASTDTFYQGLAVPSVTVTLNDPSGVTLVPVNGQNAVLEGVAQSYSAILNTPPLAAVTIDLSSDSQTTVSPAQLIFTPSNWNVPRPVVVRAVDDTAIEGTHVGNITMTVTSADANYDSLGDVNARIAIVDNDGDQVLGTTRADQIVVTSSADRTEVFVSINNKVTTIPATLPQLVLVAGDGADNIQIVSPVIPIVVVGGSNSDKLFVTGATSSNTFQLDSGAIQVNGVSVQFWQVESLVIGGLAGNDSLRVQAMPGIAAEFKGEAGNDQIFGPSRTNAWAVTSANGGTLNRTLKLTGVESWTGGSLADSFAFSAGKSLSGDVDGGGGNDALDFSPGSSAVTVNLQTNIATGSKAYRNIARIIGSKSTGDKLIGPDQSNVWNITGANAGNIAGVAFAGIENLSGGSQDDAFRFADKQIVKGTVDGGAGLDVLDYSAWTGPVVVNLQTRTATGTGGVFNLEQFIGSSSTKPDTLIGANQANAWNLNGIGSGDVNGVLFASFENLTGGSLADAFLLAAAGDWLGTLNGGSGSDVLTAFSGRAHLWLNSGSTAGTLDGRKFLGIESRR